MTAKHKTRKRALTFRVEQVGWATDWNEVRHGLVVVSNRRFRMTLYDHPTKGWSVTSLLDLKNHSLLYEVEAEDSSEEKLVTVLDGEFDLDSARTLWLIGEDLHEIGKRGAEKKWHGKKISFALVPKGI